MCFGQFGPYHHARVAALQRAGSEQAAKVLPVQIAAATSTYAWSAGAGACADLRTLCEGTDEGASPFDVFLKARKLFREERVDVAFLPGYSPARFFALFAAAKSLGIRTVMMNESHAGTEQATGWKRWIKRQIVKQFDAALVGGEPHKRHFASLGIPADKIFTGYDAVDGEFFAQRADEIRAAQKRSQDSGDRGQSEKDESPKDQETKRRTVREAYGLPERYYLNLGRMVEKKNLATLIAAYGRYCDEWRVTSDESARQAPASLVFVGSGDLEGALREQARSHGLRVVERMDWRVEKTGHGLTRIDADGSERLAADRTGQEASCRVTPAVGKGPQREADDCKLTPNDSAVQRGAVYFYGFRQIEENPVFYALAEAFVLPSLKEEWGLVVNEAMACSLPVIVSRTAGCAEDLLPGSESWQCSVGSIQSGEEKKTEDRRLLTGDSLEQRSNGFVFDPKSSDALSEALWRIVNQEAKRLSNQETDGLTEMGRRSREIVTKFSCENFARQALRAAEATGAL